MLTVVLTALAYLIGSVSFAVIISRVFALPDPRTYGSGNPGATNVLRTGRKTAAVITLLGDGIKGWLAVVVAGRFAEPGSADIALALAAVGVVVGHMYPLFFRFQGGKGVSTTLGVLVALNYYLAGGALVTWLMVAFFFRISSLAALVSAVFAPCFSLMLYGIHPITATVTAVAMLLIVRHKPNIQNLLAGKEGRIGSRSTGSSEG
jgi:acyl phosphate:glycerol-3-phosphate acyltransferase